MFLGLTLPAYRTIRQGTRSNAQWGADLGTTMASAMNVDLTTTFHRRLTGEQRERRLH
jgi:hypothetical protein